MLHTEERKQLIRGGIGCMHLSCLCYFDGAEKLPVTPSRRTPPFQPLLTLSEVGVSTDSAHLRPCRGAQATVTDCPPFPPPSHVSPACVYVATSISLSPPRLLPRPRQHLGHACTPVGHCPGQCEPPARCCNRLLSQGAVVLTTVSAARPPPVRRNKCRSGHVVFVGFSVCADLEVQCTCK